MIFIEILYDYRNLFEVYPFNYKEFKIAVKTPQRFEICNSLVDALMQLPASALFTRRYFPVSFKQAAEDLMKSATDYLLQVAKKSETVINLIAGYPTDAIEDFFLDKIYHNLSLIGNESLFRTFRELWKFQRFIQLVELDRKDYETHKIALTKGQNVFTCSMVNRKSLCKFINWRKVMVSIETSSRLSCNGTSISSFSSQSKRIL